MGGSRHNQLRIRLLNQIPSGASQAWSGFSDTVRGNGNFFSKRQFAIDRLEWNPYKAASNSANDCQSPYRLCLNDFAAE